MKIKKVYFWVLLGLIISSFVQAQTYDKLWKQVEQAQQKSLPQTVLKLSDAIYQKGEREKNSGQMLKAYMLQMECRGALTPDSLYVGIERLEKWASQTNIPMDRAILHSLLAEKYAQYANDNQWQLRRQTSIVGEAPSADMREWTLNMFTDTVRSHIQAALKDSVLLLATSSRTYIPFVELGETSRFYHHDMYHLLVSRSLDALKQINFSDRYVSESPSIIKQDIIELYNRMLSTYKASDSKEGYLLAALDYLAWKHTGVGNLNESYLRQIGPRAAVKPTDYEVALNELKEKYKSEAICAEVYLALVNHAIENEQPKTALQLCDEAIRLYPKYDRINALKNLREDILAPHLTVNTSSSAFPGEDLKLTVSHKNLNGFTVRLYRSVKGITEMPESKMKPYLLKEQHYTVLRPEDYRAQDTVFTWKAPELGSYAMRIVPDTYTKNNTTCAFNITRFKVLTCRMPQEQYQVVALDRETGHPIPYAKVTLYDNKEKVVDEFTTNEAGKVAFLWKPAYRYLIAAKDNDSAMTKQYIYGSNYGRYTPDANAEHITLLTDRSLYRPGQTVYIKGIAHTQSSDTAQVISNKEYTVKLTDANNQEVAQKKVRTNEFGSFTSDFALPAACLNGMFSLEVAGNRINIRVEEHKRPTFNITFEEQTAGYQLGDEITVKGKAAAYSGVLLQNLPVKYTVKRSSYFFWTLDRETQIASGEVSTNDNGEFAIPVRLEEDKVTDDINGVFYRYQIEAVVTNVSGETQTSVQVVSAGNHSLIMQANLEERALKDDSVSLRLNVQNLNGRSVEAEGTYRLFRAKEDSMTPLEDVPVVTGTFVANQELKVDWKHLASGSYVLKAVVKDSLGREVTDHAKTVLFSTSDRRPPVTTPTWLYQENVAFDATHPAVFYFGTSEKDTYWMMDVFSGDRLLESKALNLSDTIVRFDYPYKESYGDGVLIQFCMVRNGEVYQEQVRLTKRLPDKKLTLKWEVFRDKLRPGQTEEWKLTIKTPQGQPADAEMLATMYDASLDKIWKQQQDFKLIYARTEVFVNWMIPFKDIQSFYYWWDRANLKLSPLVYDSFVTNHSAPIFNMVGRSTGGLMIRGNAAVAQEVISIADAKSGGGVDLAESKQLKGKLMGVVASTSADKSNSRLYEEGSEEKLSAPTADLRTNFAETAFFYPQLRTNELGEVSFSFTLPESLTRWNFRGYAHTKGMLMGTLDGEAVASKEFMLTPNLPRFVRVGDVTSISASIANMTGKPQAGTVTMVLFDPITEKVISTQKQKFSLTTGQTLGVNFRFTATDKYEVMGCRLIADSGTFSDGEQQLLPVLSNKEQLTETLAMPLRGEGTRVFSLENLFNRHNKTATDRKLTVEVTGNPAWYAVQSLPSLNLPVNDDAISWATAYYANTLASHIMNSQPRIKSVFDSWKLQGGTKDTFLSNLQKNQEVKNILLSESPWVMEAQTEQQQQERIATLFDLNTIQNNNISALTKLSELQNADGAWSWYKGMNGSQYVTAYIVNVNARLAMLTGSKPADAMLALQQKAFTYLHQSALKEYTDILKYQQRGEKPSGLSTDALQYLYLIAISGEEVPEANKAAYAYYLSQVPKMLSGASVDTKSIAVVILDKAGRKKDAQDFVASLKEHLTKTDEQGMFFAFNENPYTWGGLKLPAHVHVMEALSLVGGNEDAVEEMKLWLLAQKRTQQWTSPVATADAVYALLMQGTNLLETKGDVRVTVGNEVLETLTPAKSTVPGLGYVKRSFTEKQVVNAREIKVEKRDPGIAWGAVYAQYESPLADVEQQGAELNVQKQMYVERLVNNVAQLQLLTNKTPLQVGDKVVSRLSIRLDRPMDFVQLKDQRAACFEPIDNLSGYRWGAGTGYYVDVKDASTNFFFDRLGKGLYVLEYSYRVSRSGTYTSGLAIMQSAYAPEYASHSGSITVEVK